MAVEVNKNANGEQMPRLSAQEVEKQINPEVVQQKRKPGRPRRVAPVVIRKEFDAASQPIGQDQERVLKSTGPASEALSPQIIEPIEKPWKKEKLEIEKFMRDELTVIIHESTNPLDHPRPEIQNVGGAMNPFVFIRGREMKVKRYIVEVLARMKKTRFENKKITDDQGIDHYTYPQHSGLVYPFSVLHDPDPRGRDWLRAILQEG